MEIIQKVQKYVFDACKTEDRKEFYTRHVCEVVKATQELVQKFPEANATVCLLSAWLHDIGRIFEIPGDHQTTCATKAREILTWLWCGENIISQVAGCILCHSGDVMPLQTIEQKILTTADAIAGFHGDFYLRIATLGERSVTNYKARATEKIEHGFHVKIQFDDSREQIRPRYELMKRFLEELV